MNSTTEYLCKNIQGTKFGYVQSDEISLVLTDFDTLHTDLWFDGNLQKMASIAASMATAKFNQLRMVRKSKEVQRPFGEGGEKLGNLDHDNIQDFKLAMFDARVFQITSAIEVENYFIWRQQDATRNSISSVAQSMYSPKELNGKKTNDMQEMIFEKGTNWNDFSPREKRGSVIRKVQRNYARLEDGLVVEVDTKQISIQLNQETVFTRNNWETDQETPVFSQDRNYLRFILPQLDHTRLEVQ
jgi:tRNA(His) 5'-end guanylyltransferase